MRRIFLDLGGHKGESTTFFRKHHPDADQFEYFIFEPLPGNIVHCANLDNVTIIPKAASIIDGKAKLYTGLPESGSLSDQKRSGGLDGETGIQVETIDFPEWFNDLVTGDYVPEIWLKMNIEGAEYDIIHNMYHFGLLKFIHRFYVQWHWAKIGLIKENHNHVKDMIPQDKLFPWRAMFGEKDIEWFKDSL